MDCRDAPSVLSPAIKCACACAVPSAAVPPCAPRCCCCDLGDGAGSRARGPGVPRQGSVRTIGGRLTFLVLTQYEKYCRINISQTGRPTHVTFVFPSSFLGVSPLCNRCHCIFALTRGLHSGKNFDGPNCSRAPLGSQRHKKQHRNVVLRLPEKIMYTCQGEFSPCKK